MSDFFSNSEKNKGRSEGFTDFFSVQKKGTYTKYKIDSSKQLTKEIKEIIKDYIKEKYEEHLNNEKILLIKEKNIPTVIKNLYDNNIKSLKSLIRNKLKEKYKQTYSSAITEQIILEIFHDKDININKLIKEIEFIQTKNLKNIDLPIINNSLNLNISMVDNYIIINSI